MSHELRTPLNAIVGFSQVLQEELYGELNDKQKQHLGHILTSANHLLSLINDILDLSKVARPATSSSRLPRSRFARRSTGES